MYYGYKISDPMRQGSACVLIPSPVLRLRSLPGPRTLPACRSTPVKTPRNLSLLRRMLAARLRQVAPVRPLVAASLVQSVVRCGKSSCRCATGERHASTLLTFKDGERSRSLYVRKVAIKEVRQWVEEYRRVKTLLSEISQLTLAIMSAQTRIRRENKTPPTK